MRLLPLDFQDGIYLLVNLLQKVLNGKDKANLEQIKEIGITIRQVNGYIMIPYIMVLVIMITIHQMEMNIGFGLMVV